jgi:hypothetical protein
MTDVFVWLQHGSHGQQHDLDEVFARIKRAIERPAAEGAPCGASRCVSWSTSANELRRTYDGVMLCADRVALELLPALRLFVGDGSGRRKLFSCVAHSFGGVINREVVKRLHADAALRDALTFATYVSIASPHCGISTLPLVLQWGAWALGKLMSAAYLELGLDGGKEGVMAGDMLSADHIAALQAFRHRVLVCNTCNDSLVHFGGSALMFEAAPFNAASDARLSEHVLPPFAIGGGHDAGGAPFPDDGSDARHIALTLRRAMTFTVVPVASRAWMPFAHNAIISKHLRRVAVKMYDVAEHIGATMRADVDAIVVS